MNKNEAAIAIGISVRSLQRDTQNGLIHGTHRNIKGRMVLDYDKKEVDRWKAERRRVVPESIAIAVRDTGSMDKRADNFFAKIEEVVLNAFIEGRKYITGSVNGDHKRAGVDLKDKLILSLPQAVKLSGIPRERLKNALLPDRTVLFFKDDPRLGRGYRVRKIDLDEYINALDLPELEEEEK